MLCIDHSEHMQSNEKWSRMLCTRPASVVVSGVVAEACLPIECGMLPGIAGGLVRPVLHERARHIVVSHAREIQPAHSARPTLLHTDNSDMHTQKPEKRPLRRRDILQCLTAVLRFGGQWRAHR